MVLVPDNRVSCFYHCILHPTLRCLQQVNCIVEATRQISVREKARHNYSINTSYVKLQYDAVILKRPGCVNESQAGAINNDT